MRTGVYAAAGVVAIAMAAFVALMAMGAFGPRLHLDPHHGGRTMMAVWSGLLAAAGIVFLAAAVHSRRSAWERRQLPHEVVEMDSSRRGDEP